MTRKCLPVSGRSRSSEPATTAGGFECRAAYRVMLQSQYIIAMPRITVRNSHPDPTGTPATFCAIATMKGSTGENAAAIAAVPMLTATAIRGGSPSEAQISSKSGANATSSSDICMRAPPAAKARPTTGITSTPRLFSRRASTSTRRRSAPVRSTTVNAPPERKMRKMTLAASIKPLGTATKARNTPTGAGSTR